MTPEEKKAIIKSQADAERKRAEQIPRPTFPELMHVGEDLARLERDLFDVIANYNLPPGFVIGVLEKLKLRIYENHLHDIREKAEDRAMINMKKVFPGFFSNLNKSK